MKRLTWAALLALAAVPAAADAPLTYQQPPESIRAVLDARPIPARLIDPAAQTLAVVEVRRYPTIEELSRPFLRLAGLRIDPPILLIHGEVDDNSGTFPEQSDRLFAALAATGGNVRFVKLPAEAHGYAARESVGHTLWEMSTWLRKHLGDPRQP